MPALIILLAGQAMAVMDGSILAVAAPSLRASLHASDAQLQLAVAAYTIAFGVLVVTGARLGDVLAHRRAFLIGLAGFVVFSLAGGLAPTPGALIAARVGQGASGALMTPQVLSLIQLRFEGEMRVRAIGAYSLVLAVGVAAGQILGGVLVSVHLVGAAWRPALLVNAPVGCIVLLAARRWLPPTGADVRRRTRLDFAGVLALTAALLVLVAPLTYGRSAGWPLWVWPCLAACPVALTAFAAIERRVRRRGGHPLFDLDVLAAPGVAAGAAAVLLVMAAYAGFLLSLTIHLQDGLRFSALHAGVVFAAYACGFAVSSLTWTRLEARAREWLPLVGPLAMAAALLAVAVTAQHGGWPAAAATPLLFVAGVGHACGFSPLAARLTAAAAPRQAADISGLVLTASLIGNVLGVAGFVGIYLGAASDGSAHALLMATAALAVALVVTAGCAWRALGATSRPRATVALEEE